MLIEAEECGASLYHFPLLRAILERLVLEKGLCRCDLQHGDETDFVSTEAARGRGEKNFSLHGCIHL